MIGENMSKKVFISILIGVLVLTVIYNKNNREPIIITRYASVAEMSLEEIITESDLIVIGEFISILPSRWSTDNGRLPGNATIDSVSQQRLTIFTDSIFQVNQYLKGETQNSTIRIRTFGGQVGQDRMIVSGGLSYKTEQAYLLFLSHDTGATADIDPGDFLATGVYQGVYEILDGKAKSREDEWSLEELLAHIEQSLSAEIPISPTETLTETPFPTETPTSTP